jgi:hypothetical protein
MESKRAAWLPNIICNNITNDCGFSVLVTLNYRSQQLQRGQLFVALLGCSWRLGGDPLPEIGSQGCV